MLTFLKNFTALFSNTQPTTSLNLTLYFRYYVFFNKIYNIDFNKYVQFIYTLNKFKYNTNLFTSLFLFLFYNTRLNLSSEKYSSVVKKNSIIYVADAVKHSTRTLLNVLKTLPTAIPTTLLSSKYLIRYSPTTVVKYLHNNYLNSLDILFLRKNKVFNKGRYSRNRQFYRTGVYWCLYINIIAIIGLYFWFYRFVMNFGYLWWLLFLSLASFVLAKTFNYKLYTPSRLLNSIYSDLIFFSLLVNNIVTTLLNIILSVLTKLNVTEFYKLPNIINTYTKSNLWILTNLVNSLNISKKIYIWGYNSENYYIHSVTQNFSKFVLNSKKNRFITEFVKMLLTK